MATTLSRQDEFDRGRDFVVVKNVIVNGKAYAPGDKFDTTQVTVRRLRQMYESRMIDIPHIGQPVKPTPEPQAAGDGLDLLTDEELGARLNSKGVVPRPNASREWLLRKVREAESE